MIYSKNNYNIKPCPYCGTEQHFLIPKEKGLAVCRNCNRTIDIYANGDIMKSNLDYAEPKSVTYPHGMCGVDIVTGKEK